MAKEHTESKSKKNWRRAAMLLLTFLILPVLVNIISDRYNKDAQPEGDVIDSSKTENNSIYAPTYETNITTIIESALNTKLPIQGTAVSPIVEKNPVEVELPLPDTIVNVPPKPVEMIDVTINLPHNDFVVKEAIIEGEKAKCVGSLMSATVKIKVPKSDSTQKIILYSVKNDSCYAFGIFNDDFKKSRYHTVPTYNF